MMNFTIMCPLTSPDFGRQSMCLFIHRHALTQSHSRAHTQREKRGEREGGPHNHSVNTQENPALQHNIPGREWNLGLTDMKRDVAGDVLLSLKSPCRFGTLKWPRFDLRMTHKTFHNLLLSWRNAAKKDRKKPTTRHVIRTTQKMGESTHIFSSHMGGGSNSCKGAQSHTLGSIELGQPKEEGVGTFETRSPAWHKRSKKIRRKLDCRWIGPRIIRARE